MTDDGESARRNGARGQRSRTGSGGAFRLRNWRVRRRLLAVALIPVIAAVGLGGLRIASSWQDSRDYERVQQLAELGERVTALAHELQIERDMTAGFIARGRPGTEQGKQPKLPGLERQQRATDRALASVRAQAKVVDGSYSVILREKLETAQDRLRNLFSIRFAALRSEIPVTGAISAYSAVIQDLLELNVEIAQGSGNSQLEERVRALTALSTAKEQVSQQRALFYAALETGELRRRVEESYQLANARQQSALTEFSSTAAVSRRQFYDDTVTGPDVDAAARLEAKVMVRADQESLGLRKQSDDWFRTMSTKLELIRQVEAELVQGIQQRSQALQEGARINALRDAGIVLLIILVALMIALTVARSMARPLHTLRTSALDVAGQRLPEVVRRLQQSDGRDADIRVEQTSIDSRDEIGQVARAFDQVHEEAVRLASEQAALRGNVNAMFINLSRRSQGLVERQLGLIDDLENSEQDSQQLSSLFKLDHLATRMRRHGENLLVLAGEEPGRRWGQPVPLVDVLRAAISEVEQYERIELRSPLPGSNVVGRVVNDLVHLVAELLENATSYSSRDTKVVVTGELHADGRVMLEINDSGIGMNVEELAEINQRLATQPVVDVSVSRRMGLFVVGRLAWRHGIRVQLRSSEGGGVSALVMLGADTVEAVSAGTAPGVMTGGAPTQTPSPGEAPATQYPASDSTPVTPTAPAAPAYSSEQYGETTADYGEQLPVRSAEPAGYEAFAQHSPWQTSREPAQTQPHQQPAPPHQKPMRSPWEEPEPRQTPEWPDTQGSPWEPSYARSGSGWQQEPIYHATANPPENSTSPETSPFAPGTPSQSFTGHPSAPSIPAPPAPPSTPSTSTQPSLTDSGNIFEASGSAMSEERKQSLPIFDAVQSQWFQGRSGRARAAAQVAQSASPQATPTASAPQNGAVSKPSWRSPGDEGWRVAEQTITAPSSEGTTTAGLPKRVPGRNFVPGSAGDAETGTPAAAASTPRNPEAVGGRLANYHRGLRQGRGATGEDERQTGYSGHQREQENA